MPGRITLLGSGELMSAMSRIHRAAHAALSEPPRPVFLDVTAGFETNVDAITAKAVEYYSTHFGLKLEVARYRHREQATPAEVAAAVSLIEASNFIFAGPGSPSYTVKHLRGTRVWEAIQSCYMNGAHALFASAASIAMGRYALPVYELFKVGEDPFWMDGLDLFAELGLNLAVVPHYDESSGGDNYDSRFCYVGARRFDALQELLPSDITILGIDCYTAVTFDPQRRVASVSGQGAVTTIGEGGARRWPAGSEIAFEVLQGGSRLLAPTDDGQTAARGYEFADQATTAEDGFAAVVAAVERLQGLATDEKVEVLRLLQQARRELEREPGTESAVVDLLIELRQRFREEKRFDIADMARDRLAQLGYEVHDTPKGSSWERRG